MTDSEHAPLPDSDETNPVVLRERWLRAAADLDNYRKRMMAQLRTERLQERARVIAPFLDVLDGMERAIDTANDLPESHVEGLTAIYRQMCEILSKLGVSPINPSGEAFNPEFHEALSRIPAPQYPEGTVVDVLRRGYRLGENILLRPAGVVVGAGGPPSR
jgi:molecular chaperone GrpE